MGKGCSVYIYIYTGICIKHSVLVCVQDLTFSTSVGDSFVHGCFRMWLFNSFSQELINKKALGFIMTINVTELVELYKLFSYKMFTNNLLWLSYFRSIFFLSENIFVKAKTMSCPYVINYIIIKEVTGTLDMLSFSVLSFCKKSVNIYWNMLSGIVDLTHQRTNYKRNIPFYPFDRPLCL